MRPSPRPVARAARLLSGTLATTAVLAGVGVLTASSASAETPTTWDVGDTPSHLEVLGIFVGIPLLVALVLVTIGYLSHTKKSPTYPVRPGSSQLAVEARSADVPAELAEGDGDERDRALREH